MRHAIAEIVGGITGPQDYAIDAVLRAALDAAVAAERARAIEQVKGVANALDAGADPQFYTGYKTGVAAALAAVRAGATPQPE